MGIMDQIHAQRKSRRMTRGRMSVREILKEQLDELEAEQQEEMARQEKQQGRGGKGKKGNEDDYDDEDGDENEDDFREGGPKQPIEELQEQRRIRRRTGAAKGSAYHTQSRRWSKLFRGGRKSVTAKNSTMPSPQEGAEEGVDYDESGLPILSLSLDRLVPRESPWDEHDR